MNRTGLKPGIEAQGRLGVLLVDDHPMVRERLADIINAEPDLRVCGEAEARHEALEIAASCSPSLVIIDLTLKNSDGIELIRDLRARWPKLFMLVVSMHDESLYAERAIRAGARGYITKQEASRRILLAVRCVLSGSIYLNERIATQILAKLAVNSAPAPSTPSDLLAERELQVFELTGRGLNTRQIAARLRLGVKTVETYRARIRDKLQLKEPTELLPLAISWTHSP